MTAAQLIQLRFDGLVGAFKATGSDDEKARELAIAVMARHEPTLALARELVGADS